MRLPMRVAAPLAVTAGLIAAGPASALAESPPTARAAGSSGPPPVYPSAVRTRVARTERALERAVRKIENGKAIEGAASLKVVRRQLAASWRAAKYIVRTAPPPPPADAGRVHRRAHASATYYSAPETGVRVLALQHDVAAEAAQLVDGAHGTGLDAVSRTLYFALNRRDAAIQDILRLSPPAPPPPGDGLVPVRKAGAPVATTFDTLMPDVVPDLDDEVQSIEVLKTDATDITPGGLKLLNAAETQIGKTKTFVNNTWPPLPPGD